MIKRNKVILSITIFIIAIITGGLMTYNSVSNRAKNGDVIKTDRESIIKRFPKLVDFQKCYWKADVIGNANDRVPGPTGYWMKGFVEVNKEKINSWVEEYKMKEVGHISQIDFLPPNTNIKDFKWLYSDEFNEFIKPPSFFGKFYADKESGFIYFSVEK